MSANGVKSKNYFTADDPKQVLVERAWAHKSGVSGNGYIIKKISKLDALEYVKYLIKQKYDSL